MNSFFQSLKGIQEDTHRRLANEAAQYLGGELFSYRFEGDVNTERFLLVTLQGSPVEHMFRVDYKPTPDTFTYSLVRVQG